MEMSWITNYILQPSPTRCQILLKSSSSVRVGQCPALCWEDPCQCWNELHCNITYLLLERIQRRAKCPQLWLPLIGNWEHLATSSLKAVWHIILFHRVIYFKWKHTDSKFNRAIVLMLGDAPIIHEKKRGLSQQKVVMHMLLSIRSHTHSRWAHLWAPIISSGRGMGDVRVSTCFLC